MNASINEKAVPPEFGERRRHLRIGTRFPFLIRTGEAAESFAGTTVDLSQSGAFISTEHCQHFHVGDQALLICALPAEFTGQDRTIGIRGEAVIRRVDGNRMGIAVEFSKAFKAFERVDAPF